MDKLLRLTKLLRVSSVDKQIRVDILLPKNSFKQMIFSIDNLQGLRTHTYAPALSEAAWPSNKQHRSLTISVRFSWTWCCFVMSVMKNAGGESNLLPSAKAPFATVSSLYHNRCTKQTVVQARHARIRQSTMLDLRLPSANKRSQVTYYV